MKICNFETGVSVVELQAEALRCLIEAVDKCESENARTVLALRLPEAMKELNDAEELEASCDFCCECECDGICEEIGYCPYMDDDDSCDDCDGCDGCEGCDNCEGCEGCEGFKDDEKADGEPDGEDDGQPTTEE